MARQLEKEMNGGQGLATRPARVEALPAAERGEARCFATSEATSDARKERQVGQELAASGTRPLAVRFCVGSQRYL